MWSTGAVVCSPFYRILSTCCPIRKTTSNRLLSHGGFDDFSSNYQNVFNVVERNHEGSSLVTWVIIQKLICHCESQQSHIPFNELQSKTLLLVVFDYDRLSKDDKMGQLSIPLESIDFGTTTDIDRYLSKPENDDDVSTSFILNQC
uniref:C2 domain-containing protein n=1 Tax=Heterorhabditis bacteriophora TaxID=37862 RepID=A0A1I7WYY6_HETBA